MCTIKRSNNDILLSFIIMYSYIIWTQEPPSKSQYSDLKVTLESFRSWQEQPYYEVHQRLVPIELPCYCGSLICHQNAPCLIWRLRKATNMGYCIFFSFTQAGQEFFRSLVRSFYKGIAAVFFVFAIDNKQSLKQL